jgi:Membrane bound beta barrel domain (DUF5777)
MRAHSSARFQRTAAALASAACLTLILSAPAAAQATDTATPPPRPAEPELNIINLPTTRLLPRHKSYFRLTHRFARDLRRGSFGQLAEDLFALDNGAIIGLEYRFGITDALQAGVHRSLLSRTIQVFSRYDGWRQSESMPVSISLMGSLEGLDNMSDHLQPGIAATISRVAGSHVVLYTTPAFVARTKAADFLSGHDHGVSGTDEHAAHEHTFFVGLGGRLLLGAGTYVAGEYSPRVAGHDPGRGTWGVALEKKTGGHTFQVNFTNSFGTTFGQLARGGSEHDVYLGFNITRLF